ncbi:MAG: extracellular solute-binding protein [Roseburia sp.]|nr:extracellular solute-binding protein [Roseburia sp.]MCM1098983.1 extracellular solute-binding protein [Ruminococcus flavefaciens]
MKRKMISRTVAAACVATVLLGGLTACGNGGQTNEPGQSQNSQGNSSANNGASQGGTNEEERPTLTMWSCWTCNDQVSDPGDTAFYQAIEEACNVDLKFIDSTGGKDGLSILIGTNDLPDIIFEWDGNIGGGVQKSLADGTILPLNDLMDQGYMPNFKAYLESDPEVDKLCINDDGLYAWVPMIRRPDSPLVFNGNMIRKDWLDDLNLEIPETIDEMEKVLLAFKEKKGCEAGYSFAGNDYSYFVMSYGICESFYVEDGVVKYGFLQDSYKDFLERFNKWLNLGILDPDAFSQDWDAFYAKIATDKIGILRGNTGGVFGQIETMKANNPELNFVPMAFPVLNKGETFPVDASSYRVNNIGMAISSTCENLEAAARVLDYVYGEEGDLLANYGIEGKSFEYVDGVPTFTELVTNNPDGLSIQQALSFYAGSNNKPFLCSNGMMLQTYALDVQKESLTVWSTPDATIKTMPPVTMSTQEAEEYNQIMTDINTYVDEFKLKFILGSEPLDNFDSFRDNIRKMNIERALEIQQAAYDRFISR